MDIIQDFPQDFSNHKLYQVMERACCYSIYRKYMEESEDMYFILEKPTIKESFDQIKVSDWKEIYALESNIFKISPLHTVPILPALYFKCRFSGMTFFASVYTDFEQRQSELFLHLINGGEWKWVGSALLSYNGDMTLSVKTTEEENADFEFSIGINTCFSSFYRDFDSFRVYARESGWYREMKQAEAYINKIGKRAYQRMGESILKNAVHEYLVLLNYIHTVLDARQTKSKSAPSEFGVATSDSGSSRGQSRSKAKVINLGGVSVEIPEKSKTTKRTFYQRKCLSWSVRGHYRYYKNGKTVFIKPYKKGLNRDKDVEMVKTYQII